LKSLEWRLLLHIKGNNPVAFSPADRQPQRQNPKSTMASKKKVTAKTAVKFKDLSSKKSPKGGSALKLHSGWAT
jgi:hypothetical protein